MNPMLRATAPSSSTAKVILAIWKSSLKVLRGEPAFSVSSCTVRRRLNPTLWPMSRAARVVTVMMPKPSELDQDHHHDLPEVGEGAGDIDRREPRNGDAARRDEERIYQGDAALSWTTAT